MELRKYQATGAEWLSEKSVGLLADEMGLGKTCQAIRAAVKQDLRNVLIICPPVARDKWVREWVQWSDQRIDRIGKIGRSEVPSEHCNVCVMSEAALSYPDDAGCTYAMSRDWDLLIVDEAQAFGSRTSKRSKALYGAQFNRGGLSSKAENIWLLSATPARNHAGEMWTHLNALRPDLIWDTKRKKPVSAVGFEDRFCNVFVHETYGRVIRGSKPGGALRKLLDKGDFMLRRTKAVVGAELPALTIVDTELDYPVPAGRLSQLRIPPSATPEEIICLMNRVPALSSELLALGMHKAAAAVEYARTILYGGSDDKLILFFKHREAITSAMTWLREFNPVEIHGGTSEAKREEAIFRFQNATWCRVLVGQIKACGTAIDLTAASRVLIVEPAWSPADNLQAIGRAHRIGTTHPVIAEFLSVSHPVDRIVARVLAQKTLFLNENFGD
jgi:SWI/SNF-related matrix-associated actin-dependent regulator 1 of chromatin subfamily A